MGYRCMDLHELEVATFPLPLIMSNHMIHWQPEFSENDKPVDEQKVERNLTS